MRHIDYEAAYLNAALDKPVFMRQVHGFEIGPPGSILKVHKALYGLRQSGREWYLLISSTIVSRLALKQSIHDPCVFFDPVRRIYIHTSLRR